VRLYGSTAANRLGTVSNPSDSPAAGWYGNPQVPGQERWWDGRNWSEHFRTAPTPNAPARPSAQSSLACPVCQSEDVKTLRLIHEHGTSTGTGTTTGWVAGSGNQPGHIATFATRTKTLTDAARKAAPPKKRFNGVVLIVIGVLVAAIACGLGGTLALGSAGSYTSGVYIVVGIGILALLGGIILAVFDSAYNRTVPAAFAEWDRSWQCQRCGRVFHV
jgi:hypothetical protein